MTRMERHLWLALGPTAGTPRVAHAIHVLPAPRARGRRYTPSTTGRAPELVEESFRASVSFFRGFLLICGPRDARLGAPPPPAARGAPHAARLAPRGSVLPAAVPSVAPIAERLHGATPARQVGVPGSTRSWEVLDPRHPEEEMIMRSVMAVVTVAALLGACSGPTYWRNDNPRDWSADLYDCTQENSMTITAGGGTGPVSAVNAGEVGSVRTDYAMRDLCLKSRGWYQVAAPAAPASAPPVAPVAPAPSASPVAVSTQDAWISVARRGQDVVWAGVWGRDTAARSDCETRTEKARQAPSNAQWSHSLCRSISVSFQEGAGARFGPGWVVVGSKEFIGGPTEQACVEQRIKLMVANPSQTFAPCRQFWFSSELGQ